MTVSYDPRSRKTQLHIEGDARYDPKLIREAKKHQEAARKQALLSGAPITDATNSVHFTNVVHERIRWTVPASCPECGARVDQSTASIAPDPKCEFCGSPLPRQRDHRREDY